VAEPEQIRIIGISDGVLEALNVAPEAGRWLLAEDQTGATRPPPSVFKAYTRVMLSYGYWQRRFGGDRSVIGRTVIVDSRPKEIVGVMPRGFRIVNADADMIFPLAFDRARITLAGFSIRRRRARPESRSQANAASREWSDLMSSWPARRAPSKLRTWENRPRAASS
jgi:hypothetical protein